MDDLLARVISLVTRLVLCQAHREKHISIQEVHEELQRKTVIEQINCVGTSSTSIKNGHCKLDS